MENEEKVLKYADLKPRYNEIGEWRPLVYNGDADVLSGEVYEITKSEHDKRIYGALFYIKATSCSSIEFIVKTHFRIPSAFQQIGSQFGKIQLHKLDFSGYDQLANIQIYDGTLELVDTSVEVIRNGLNFIDVTLHRLAFRLDTKVEWFMKYPHYEKNPDNIINLKEVDVELLKEYFVDNLRGDDSTVFDMAISWYMNGNNSNNPFVSFLSYCISMESLVDRFLNGKMEVSAVYKIDEPKKNEDNLLQCIRENHDNFYVDNPKKFIEDSYFNCVKGVQKRLRRAMEVVFGVGHEYVNLFFDKKEGYSLYDLRSNLAHGSFATLDIDHTELIEKRLSDMKNIAHQFILRLSTATLAGEIPKEIKPSHQFSMVLSSPRCVGVVSSLDILSNKDWRIRPEWLF